jgi:hypothetical protein
MEEIDYSKVMGPQYGVGEKFKRKNCMLWKFKVKVLLKAKKLWGLRSGKEVKPNPINVLRLLVYERKERRALNLLVQGLSFMSVKKETTTKEIWESF